MSRVLAALSVLLILVPFVQAQTTPGEPIRLTLHPGPLPEPSLKYRLLPAPRDQVPGNAATLYYRSEALYFENLPLLQDVMGGGWYLWLGMPLKDLPREDIRSKLAQVRPLLREIDAAALRRDCDWQLSGRKEGFALLIPDVQGYRALATVLAVRARLDIAEGHLPEALQDLQSGYALAHSLGRAPFLIHILVGLAIANIMDGQLEELLQQAGAPNLYWSLTVLPRPFADPQAALQEEGAVLENMFPALKHLDTTPMSLSQVADLQDEIRKLLDDLHFQRPTAGFLAQGWSRAGVYPEAKQALLAQGIPDEQVEAMPTFQVLALYSVGEYRNAWEELVKWTYVPDGWSNPDYKKAAARYDRAVERLDRLFFYGVLKAIGFGAPALQKVFEAFRRTDRRFAALRCIEAVRLYAAGHKGQLPARLKDVTEVPIPDDPTTGKPFEYTVTGDKGRLAAPLPPGPPPPPYLRPVYELTMAP